MAFKVVWTLCVWSCWKIHNYIKFEMTGFTFKKLCLWNVHFNFSTYCSILVGRELITQCRMSCEISYTVMQIHCFSCKLVAESVLYTLLFMKAGAVMSREWASHCISWTFFFQIWTMLSQIPCNYASHNRNKVYLWPSTKWLD